MLAPGAHILLICHTFPPAPGVGGRRWAKFAKVLARRGWTVHVICAEHRAGTAPSPWTDDVRSPRIQVHTLPRRYPSVVNRWPLTRLSDKLAHRFWLRALPLLVKGNPRDSTVFWHGQLHALAARLIRMHGIRHVIATGAPFRLLYHAVGLKRTHPGLHVTCDLRDPWTWWDNYGHGLLPPRRFADEVAMERAVMEGSDRITSPSSSVLGHLAEAYPHCSGKMVRLPHAIDPDEVVRGERPTGRAGFRLIYAGTWYGAEEADRYFAAVVQAFHTLKAAGPTRYQQTRFDLYIAANDASKARQQVKAAGLEDRIHFHAPLPPKAIAAEIAKADAALIFIPPKNRDLMGTKFHELFHLQVPVIHVGEPGFVSRTIVEHRMGCSFRVNELAEGLPAIITGRALPQDPA